MSDESNKENTSSATSHESKAASAPAKDSAKESSNKVESSSNWALGLAIIIIGGLLLAKNLGFDWAFLYFQHWWALFILLAAIPPLQSAFNNYRKSGWSSAVANSLISAGAIVILALLFLLNLSLWTWWPVFIIVAGLMVMAGQRNS